MSNAHVRHQAVAYYIIMLLLPRPFFKRAGVRMSFLSIRCCIITQTTAPPPQITPITLPPPTRVGYI